MTDPVPPADRKLHLAGTTTAGLGALLLLLAGGTTVWALASGTSSSRPSFGTEGVLAWGIAGVCGLVVLPLGFHYLDVGQRMRRTGRVDLDVILAVSGLLAFTLGAVPFKLPWAFETALAAGVAALFGLHTLLLLSIGRPPRPPG